MGREGKGGKKKKEGGEEMRGGSKGRDEREEGEGHSSCNFMLHEFTVFSSIHAPHHTSLHTLAGQPLLCWLYSSEI